MALFYNVPLSDHGKAVFAEAIAGHTQLVLSSVYIYLTLGNNAPKSHQISPKIGTYTTSVDKPTYKVIFTIPENLAGADTTSQATITRMMVTVDHGGVFETILDVANLDAVYTRTECACYLSMDDIPDTHTLLPYNTPVVPTFIELTDDYTSDEVLYQTAKDHKAPSPFALRSAYDRLEGDKLNVRGGKVFGGITFDKVMDLSVVDASVTKHLLAKPTGELTWDDKRLLDTDSLLSGNGNVTIAKDNTTGKITISTIDTIYADATTTTSGLMSSTDKAKLDTIAANANAYTLPVATTTTLGGVTIGNNLTIDDTGKLSGDDPYVLPRATTATLGGVKVDGTSITIDNTGVISSPIQTTVSGNAGSASKLQTARSISLTGDVSGTVSFDGSKDVSMTTAVSDDSHAHNWTTVKGVDVWSIGNFSNGYSAGTIPSGLQGLISDVTASRTACLPASDITVEYSTDGGTTWLDQGLSDNEKTRLFIGYRNGGMFIGKNTGDPVTTDWKSRITIQSSKTYSSVDKFFCGFCTQTHRATVDIDRALVGDPTTFTRIASAVPVSGWTDDNICAFPSQPFGGTAANNTKFIRFTFNITQVNLNPGYETEPPAVFDIRLFGSTSLYSTSIQMARNGHLYTWDTDQNATFPATITATTFKGQATSATKLATGRNITLTGGISGTTTFDGSTDVTIATTLVPATSTTLGGVKAGSNITIDANGVISATAAPYSLPTASASVLGGVKVGDNLTITNGVLSSAYPSVMTGATSTVAGKTGLVPAPAITDKDKFLGGDGTYHEVTTIASTSATTLPANSDATVSYNATTKSLAFGIPEGDTGASVVGAVIDDDTDHLILTLADDPVEASRTRPVFTGAYSSTKTYTYYDAVTYTNGNSYICTHQNGSPAGTLPTDTSRWTSLVDSSGLTPKTTKVVAGTGLTGGGALTGDVTLTAKLSNSVSTTDDTTAASCTAVKTVYDLTNSKLSSAGGHLTGSILIRDTQATLGTAPAANTEVNYYWGDNTGAIMGGVCGVHTTTNRQVMQLAVRNTADTRAMLSVGISETGSVYTDAPIPSTDSDDQSIATTNWVNTKITGYVPPLATQANTATTATTASYATQANTATTATTASYANQLKNSNGTPMQFTWSDPGYNPSYVWGSNDGVNFYPFPPTRFDTHIPTGLAGANVTLPAGGVWAFVALSWGSDWGVPIVGVVEGGTYLDMSGYSGDRKTILYWKVTY